MEQAQPEARHRRLSPILWMVLLLLVVYPLSTGPVLRIYAEMGGQPERIARTVYEPLVLLSENCAPVDRFLDWYVRKLWGV